MALIHIDGFDHYGTDTTRMTEGVYDQVDAAFTLSAVNPRTGARCLRRDSSAVEANLVKNLDSGRDTVGTGLAFSIDQLPSGSNSYILFHIDDEAGSEQLIFFVGVNGEVFVTLGDRATLLAQSDDNVVVEGSYTHIEAGVRVDAGVTAVQTTGEISDLEFSGKTLSASETDSIVDAFVGNGDVSLYLLDNTPNTIFQYEMSTPGDVTTATYTGKSFSTQSQVGSANNHSITFKPDGSKCYVTTASSSRVTFQYSLSTPWDIATASLDSSFSSAQDSALFAIQFNNSGNLMIGVGDASDKLYEYSLSSPWDISTATFTGKSFDNSNELTDAHNLRFNLNGSKMYLLGAFGNTIFQYNLSTGFDISTAVFSGESLSIPGVSETHGFAFNSNLSSVYIAGFISDTLFQFSFPFVLEDSDGIIEVRVNGVTVISSSNKKTRSNNDDNYHKVSLSCGSSAAHGVTTDVDDWYIWDDTGSWNNSFLGDRRCYFIKPNQDTNISDFEPSSGSFGYKMIDDDSPDDDSTYIIAEAYLQSGSPLSGVSEFEIEDLPSGSSLISGINVVTRSAKTDSTSAEIYTSLNSGAESLSNSAHILTTSYGYFSDIYEYNPLTIASLTRYEFSGLSVSITADELESGQAFDSPEDVVSPTDSDFIIPTSGLITHYTMENISAPTVFDETGNFDGTLFGTPTVNVDNVDFDGTNDRIDNTRDTKVQTWAWFVNITPDVIGANDAIIDHVAGISATNLRFGSGVVRFFIYNGAFTILEGSVTAATNYRIVAQHDGTDTELWVNGTLVDSVSGFGAITYGGTEAGRRIGADATTTAGRFFDGKMYEYAEYNRLLTSTEIATYFS